MTTLDLLDKFTNNLNLINSATTDHLTWASSKTDDTHFTLTSHSTFDNYTIDYYIDISNPNNTIITNSESPDDTPDTYTSLTDFLFNFTTDFITNQYFDN